MQRRDVRRVLALPRRRSRGNAEHRDRPACVPCAYVASSHRSRRLALAFAFLTLAAGSAPLVALRWQLWPDFKISLGVFALVVLLVFAFLLHSASEPSRPVQPQGEHEAADDGHAMDGAEHPLRGRGRRVVSALSPKLSGTTAAVVAGLAFALTAVLLPHALAPPRWLEIEAILAAWWALSTLAFAALLHRGFHLVDDWVYFAPWNRPREGKGSASGCGDGCSGADFPGGDGEGCLIAVVIAVLALLLFGAAWLLVEIAGPLLFLPIYLLVTAPSPASPAIATTARASSPARWPGGPPGPRSTCCRWRSSPTRSTPRCSPADREGMSYGDMPFRACRT